MRERALIDSLLKPLARHPAARGLSDDAAVLTPPLGRDIVLTHDTLVSGIHYLASDPPEDIAWRLVAVNLSDLAAMGARPLGLLLALGLSGAEGPEWIRGFVAGLDLALRRWDVPLLGGDTVSGVGRTVLGLTAVGESDHGRALSRSGARPGDLLYVTGNIGDAGLGLAVARGQAPPDEALLARYRRPEPRLDAGTTLATLATAALDVSDGLLIDAERLAIASGVSVTVDLAQLPVSRAAEARMKRTNEALLELATSGDDYELLFTAPPESGEQMTALSRALGLRISRIGIVQPLADGQGAGEGSPLTVLGLAGERLAPARLGWEH
jgi:thiamine-monophosphate kinase